MLFAAVIAVMYFTAVGLMVYETKQKKRDDDGSI
jgi:hypothetical protein